MEKHAILLEITKIPTKQSREKMESVSRPIGQLFNH